MMIKRYILFFLGAVQLAGTVIYAAPLMLEDKSTPAGYLARLLINETPFPGERGWQSETDSRAAMIAILHVLNSRLTHIPDGYDQLQIAAVRTTNIIDMITAGGEKGQCDGFYRNTAGECVAVPRVHQRIERLVLISSEGEPGRFARLLAFSQGLATAYLQGGMTEADRFAGITRVGQIRVTGRAYSWMTGQDCYHPGGQFVRISNQQGGILGGNRFFTLKRKKP